MLERIPATDGVVFYQSPLLARIGIPHGFSTRIGGVSSGPFNALNLGNPNGCPVQDELANIAANYARLQGALQVADRRRVFVHQVHGNHVASASPGEAFDCNLKADAIVSSDRAVAAAVRTADCVPILLATGDGKVVAAVHAGWRGVVAEVVLRAAERMRDAWSRIGIGDATPPIVAAIGPSISFDAFEVGPEVAEEFERAFNGDAAILLKPSKNAGKAMVDLREALRIQLFSTGHVSGIDVSTSCSWQDDAEFFSHRRDNGVTGRMAALIGTV